MKGILALLMASIMMVAMIAPAMSDDAGSSATVGDVAPDICCKMEEPDDDDVTEGIQVNPVPGGTKTVTIKACVCDGNGNDDIGNVTATVTGPGGFSANVNLALDGTVDCTGCTCIYSGVDCTGYSGTFDMACNDLAGMYTVVVRAEDADIATAPDLWDELSNQFEYMEGIAISVTDMAFGSMAPGGSASSSHVVTNQGNGAVDFDDVDSNGYDVLNDEIMWSEFTGPGTLLDDAMTTTYDSEDIAVSGNLAVPFDLNVPAGTTSGDYTGTTTFTPSKAV